MYVSCPAVKGNVDLSSVELEENLNSTSPVLNLRTFCCPANLYSGILNVHSTLPAPLVTNALPSTGLLLSENSDDTGVIRELTAFLSKCA